MKQNLALLALSTGAFAIGVTEISPMGILPVIATGVGVSIPTAGLLITAYAIGVTLGAPLVSLSTTRLPRRGLLIGLFGIYVLGNVMAALSTGYGMLLAARIITSLCHGTFFGVGAVVAGSLMPPGRQAQAVATMFMGLTVANVIGVPAATWLGEVVSWRATFWSMVAIGILTMVTIRSTIPRLPAPKMESVLSELVVLKRAPVLIAMGLTALVSSALFTILTYISPILHIPGGPSTEFITAMLTLLGIGMCLGNWLGGKFSDRSVKATLIASLIMMLCSLILLSLVLPYRIPTAVLVFLYGISSFSIIPALQIKVMVAASDAPNLASTVNIGAFNLGNAAGAVIGGAVIKLGLGYNYVILAGAAVVAISLLFIVLIEWRGQKTRDRQTNTCEI